jgi:hypothetical protein
MKPEQRLRFYPELAGVNPILQKFFVRPNTTHARKPTFTP